jgi:DNA-binding transcriptional ArsR family regulator
MESYGVALASWWNPTAAHLRVLKEAGLVDVGGDAQRRLYRVTPGPSAQLDAWLAPYRSLWSGRLDALERHLAIRED